ncbi:MAG TPA: hypothetical protein VGE57_04480 [Solimonas sp.]
MIQRLTHAALGALFSVPVAVVCWWLYGLAHSINYLGPGLDPVLRHWLTWIPGLFAVLGASLNDNVGSYIVEAISGIFHFETDVAPDEKVAPFACLVFLAISVAAIWFTAPSNEAAR